MEDDVKVDVARLYKELERSQAKEEAGKKAKEYVCIQKCAVDHVAETTISVVQLPSDEMKDVLSDVRDVIFVLPWRP